MFEFRCRHEGCYLPWAYIYNGVVSVQSRHHGQIHTNAIAIVELYHILKASQGSSSLLPIDLALSPVRQTEVTHPLLGTHIAGFEMICIDKRCTLPWAVVADGLVSVLSWHGEQHVNTVHVDVIRLLFGLKYRLAEGER